jgi:hypothetical protein
MDDATQKFMGSGQLIDRLAAQIKYSGFRGDAKAAAIAQLQKRGHVDKDGKLTAEGRERNAMTAEERAIDRAKKRSGKPESAYEYDPRTNRATIKKR